MKAALAELAPAKIQITAERADFRDLMEAEQRRIYLLCLRLLRNSDEADTATQDVFFRAYRALQQNGATPIEDPAKWLTRITVNACLDRLRSRRWRFWRQRPSQSDEESILFLTRASGPGPERAAFAGEIARRLSAALETLSVRQRSVFLLRHEENLRLEEIGDLLGLDVGTVKVHMSRAIKKLRELLGDLYGGKALE